MKSLAAIAAGLLLVLATARVGTGLPVDTQVGGTNIGGTNNGGGGGGVAAAAAAAAAGQHGLQDSTLNTAVGVSADGKAASFTHAFAASFSVMIVSELGDKTFFIAAIMAMNHARGVIFAGAIFALGVMTVLSAYLGFAVTVIPRVYTMYLSTFLFVFFGLKMLREGWTMSADEGAEELEEVTQELKKKDEELQAKDAASASSARKFILCSPIFIQALTLTFLAEWGDRSQIATIILGAREDPVGVCLGGILGHSVCTFIAVMGGRMVAQRISIRTVTLVGGCVFLIFALSGLLLESYAEPQAVSL